MASCILCSQPAVVGALCAGCRQAVMRAQSWRRRWEDFMAHKGQVGEQKGGALGGKPTDMKTVKDVATGKRAANEGHHGA